MKPEMMRVTKRIRRLDGRAIEAGSLVWVTPSFHNSRAFFNVVDPDHGCATVMADVSADAFELAPVPRHGQSSEER